MLWLLSFQLEVRLREWDVGGHDAQELLCPWRFDMIDGTVDVSCNM